MELQRNQASLDYWEMAADFTATQEEHAEMIVPDHCPDIARILSAEGNVFLQNSEVRDGKAEISGTVQIAVLYIPEKSALVQSMNYIMPFRMTESCPQECTVVRASVMAEEITARTLNPRKIQLQCRLAGQLSAYRWVSLNYTCGVLADPKLCLEILPRQETVRLVKSLTEKEFTYQDTLHLPQNRGAVASILSTRIHSAVEEAKIIGTKAIVKGRYLATFLIKYESGSCESSSFEMPFSHMTEIVAPQNAGLSARQVLTDVTTEAVPNEDGGGELRISVFSRLQLSVCESHELTVVSDLYSTAYEVSTECQELKLLDAEESQIRRQIWQDTLEVGVPAERVLLLSASCGDVLPSNNSDDIPELRTTLRLHALYLTEDGRVLSAERSAEVRLPCPDATEGLRCWASCGEEISSVMTADGMIVRIPVDFHLEARKLRSIRQVAAIHFDENAPKDPSHMPSLVLRKKGAQDSLWSLAKRHDSSMQEILTANGCVSEEEIPSDQLLLIPRRRG